MMKYKRKCSTFFLCFFIAFALSAQASTATDDHFDKYFSFFNDTSKPLHKEATKIKEWKSDEQELVKKLLEKAKGLSPEFIERACALAPLKLVRCERFYFQTDKAWLNMPRSALAVADTDKVVFCDGFFAETDEQKQLAMLLHELTHEADLMRRVAFTPEWMKYFNANFRVEYRNYQVEPEDPKYKPYASNLCEGLADTYPKYLLGEKIADKPYFEEKILPILLRRSPSVEMNALKNFFAAEVAFKDNDFVLARNHMEKAIDFAPEAIKANNVYVYILNAQGVQAGALAWSKKCIDLMDAADLPANEPERVAMYGMRAWLLSTVTGDYPEAKRLIEESLKIRPADEFLIRLLQHCNERMQKQSKQALKDVT